MLASAKWTVGAVGLPVEMRLDDRDALFGGVRRSIDPSERQRSGHEHSCAAQGRRWFPAAGLVDGNQPRATTATKDRSDWMPVMPAGARPLRVKFHVPPGKSPESLAGTNTGIGRVDAQLRWQRNLPSR